MPHDLSDFLVTLIIGSFQVIALFVVPGLIIYLLTNNVWAGAITFLISYCTFFMFSIFRIAVTETGIIITRLFGKPKKLNWSQIHGYAEASPKDVVLNGWLWPLFPAQEMTIGLTCKGFVKLQHENGFFYYPPDNKVLFIETIEKYGIKKL